MVGFFVTFYYVGRKAIHIFREKVNQSDRIVRKRVVQFLFEGIRIYPKEGNPRSRFIEIKGSYIPLTRLNMASPTGFEPVLSA
jgi:hypothetical protein